MRLFILMYDLAACAKVKRMQMKGHLFYDSVLLSFTKIGDRIGLDGVSTRVIDKAK